MRRLRTIVAALGLAVAGSLSAGTPAHAATAHQPVIFVHGLSSTAGIWTTAVSTFKAAGYSGNELFTFSYNWGQSNVTTASQFGTYLDQVRKQTGWSKVDVVTHSMGGLNTRYCIKYGSCANKIDDWVSLGGPNHGSAAANLCYLLFQSCRDMSPGSSFLSTLNRTPETTSGAASWTTFASPCDELVPSGVALAGATNRTTACVLHLQEPSDPTILANVISTVR